MSINWLILTKERENQEGENDYLYFKNRQSFIFGSESHHLSHFEEKS
jgi:hypothetical protein